MVSHKISSHGIYLRYFMNLLWSRLYKSSVPCSTIKCKLLTLEIKIKKPIYMHCKLILWLTLVDINDQQEVNQCYTFTLSSSVLQHCGRRPTTFQRNRLPPPFRFQESLKLTMNMEAVRFPERLVPTNQTTSQCHNAEHYNNDLHWKWETESLQMLNIKIRDLQTWCRAAG
jgi:hypothetical protein